MAVALDGHFMAEHRPKFPDSLPPPVEMIEGPRHIHLTEKDLQIADDIKDLVSDLYWHSEDNYYLFFRYGEGVNKDLLNQLEHYGVASRKTELYFYRRPHPAYENDFVKLLPDQIKYEWQRQAAQGEMYGRVSLSLEPWQRKQLDIAQAAQATASIIDNNQPVLDLKPGLWGFNLNLRSLFRTFKTLCKSKQR